MKANGKVRWGRFRRIVPSIKKGHMHKYKYTFEGPFTLEMLAANQADADQRLREFNDKLNLLTYEMRLIVQRGQAITCTESDV